MLTVWSSKWVWGAVAVFLLLLSFWHPLEECKRDTWTYHRHSNPDSRGTAPIPYRVRFHLSQTLVQISWIVLSAYLYFLKHDGRHAVLVLLQCVAWFPAIFVIEWAKSAFDSMCATASHRGNGISGHFFYFSWAIYSAYAVHAPLSPMLLFMVPVLGLQGFFTVYYGYHSLRQALLGAALGSLYASATYWVLGHFLVPKGRSSPNS